MIRLLCVLFGVTAGIFSAPSVLFVQDLLLGLIAIYVSLFVFNVVLRPERLLERQDDAF